MAETPQAVFLMGPTASGKSALALSLADRFPFEIVNVDSASVYRGMDVGTAKPAPATLQRHPHHLLDCRDPTEPYSAAQFRGDALRVMGEIVQRRRVPLLVGGTMLYFRALLRGLDELPPANPEVRARIEHEAEQLGWPAMHACLARVDQQTAGRLEPGDAQRIQRALEVYRVSGQPLSGFHARATRQPLQSQVLSLGLVPSDRGMLHRRIAERFDAMLASGLEDEVRRLRERHVLDRNMPSMRAVGYRQMWQWLEGELSREAMRERGIVATRQLAKRQLTWLRQWPDLKVFDPLSATVRSDLEQEVARFLRA